MKAENSSTVPITFALSKGRILDETLPLLKAVGIEPEAAIHKSRKLIFSTNQADVRLVVIRATDVPTYVQYGGADLGITGKDVLMEHGGDGLYELMDLCISQCKLQTAVPVNPLPRTGRKKVATKFVNVAKRYYAKRGEQIDIIKLYGAMELAPILGLADEIVDIVDTGNTLRANGLEPRDTISDISSRLVVNRAAMKTKHHRIQALVDALERVIPAQATS